MSVTKRIRKNGNVVYEIRIARGRNPETGKQLPPFTKTFVPPENCPANKAMKLAQREEIIFEQECKKGYVQPPEEKKKQREEQAKQELTIADITDEIFEVMKSDIKKNTALSYSKTISYFRDYAGETFLKDVDKNYIRSYLSALFDKGYVMGSVKHTLYVLRRFFNVATECGYYSEPPTKGASVPKDRGVINDDKAKAFTRDELKSILTCVSGWPLAWRTVVQFMLESGCRAGEVCGLQWQDIDFKTGTVYIRHNLQIIKEGYYITSPKSNKNRTLYLPQSSKALAMLKALQEDKAYKGTNQFVFHTRTGVHLTCSCINARFKRLSETSGVPDIHCHKFRHTMASMAIQAGVDIVTVSKLLGHSSPTITAGIYLHTDEDQKRNGLTKLDNLLSSL